MLHPGRGALPNYPHDLFEQPERQSFMNTVPQEESRLTPFSWGSLRKRFFAISPEEARFERRGFHTGPGRHRLEHIGDTFLLGYHAALEETASVELVSRLNEVNFEMRGFAFEGAAMGLALLDMLTPWKKDRWLSFVRDGARAHLYMVHVGVGWALARVGRLGGGHPPARLRDPLLRWLAVDGYGFHEGYFYWPRFVKDKAVPNKLSGYALRVFDQGLGRSIWFVEGADVERIPATINSFPAQRRADLWSGVGLACAYAGGVNQTEIHFLREAATLFQSHMAQGAAFAAKTRYRAGNLIAHTRAACEVLCRTSAKEAAEITDAALQDLPLDGEVPAYEKWRQRIQAHFAVKSQSYD